jgi:hypothetical protein
MKTENRNSTHDEEATGDSSSASLRGPSKHTSRTLLPRLGSSVGRALKERKKLRRK